MAKKEKRESKTITEEKTFKLNLHSLNITLSYSEVCDLIDYLKNTPSLSQLRKDLMKWYSNLK